MNAVLSATPTSGVPASMHVCGQFVSEGERRAIVGPFLHRGAERGERLVYVADPRRGQAVVQLLRALDLTGDNDNPVELWSTADLYRSNGTLDAAQILETLDEELRRTLASGYPALRIVAEMSTSGSAPAPAALAAYERAVSAALTGGTLSALCQYDRRAVPRPLLDAGMAAHPLVAEARGRAHERTLVFEPNGRRVRVRGEVDLSNTAHFGVALREHLPRSGDLHLDLGALRFIGLDGVRVLCRVARELPEGCSVVVHRPPQSLTRCLEQVEHPGLVLEDGR